MNWMVRRKSRTCLKFNFLMDVKIKFSIFLGFLRVSSGGVDREIADTFRLVIRAGREDCGVNNTGGDGNESKRNLFAVMHSSSFSFKVYLSIYFGLFLVLRLSM